MTFDAVIFDCDGVLVDSEILALEESAAYLRGHGFGWSAADLVRIFTGLRDDIFAEKLTAAYRDIHGVDPKPEVFDGLIETRRSKRDQLQPVPGAHDMATALSIPAAIASSSKSIYLESKLKRTKLHEHFDPHIYSAELVREGKPAPDIFLYAAEQLNIAPSRCLVIEDSVNGVIAGLAAGMPVWGFVGGGHCFDGHAERLSAAGAERVVEDFPALTALLNN